MSLPSPNRAGVWMRSAFAEKLCDLIGRKELARARRPMRHDMAR